MVRYQEQTVTPNRSAHVAFNDSDPEAEYQESRNKARALLRAAEEAMQFQVSSA